MGNKATKKKIAAFFIILIILVVIVAAVIWQPNIMGLINGVTKDVTDDSQYPDPAEIKGDYALGDYIERVNSNDAVEISLEVAAKGYKHPQTIIIMPIYSEQLTAAFPVLVLAGQEKAPILLTPNDSLDPRVQERILTTCPQKIYIAGGLSAEVIGAISEINPRTKVEILSGDDQWDTANIINSKLTHVKGAFVFGADAMGQAVLIASFAANHSYAIIPAKEDGSLPDGVTLPDENVYLIDGKLTVNDIPGSTRLSGFNVFALNRTVLESLNYDFAHAVVLNSADDFCIGIVAASYAAMYNAPIILSGQDGTFSGVTPQKKDEIMAASCALIGNQSKLSDDVQAGFSRAIDIQKITAQWQSLQPKLSNSAKHIAEPYLLTPPYALGKLSDDFVRDGLNMLNFVRCLAGLPSDITLDSKYSEICQSAAILLRYEFSHTPKKPLEMSQTFYQKAISGTSRSNIAKGFDTLADSIQNGYMRDSDTEINVSLVGHRRWILNPLMQKTGLGFIIDSNSSPCTALFSLDQSRQNVPSYQWVAWPGQGVFPIQFFDLGDPWSISLNTDKYSAPRLSDVKVTLTEVATNTIWTFSAQDNTYSPGGKYFNVDTQNIGTPACIIFRPDNVKSYKGRFHVSITGVKDKQGQETSIEYDVNFFDMNEYLRVTTL